MPYGSVETLKQNIRIYESEFSTDNKDSRLKIVKYVLLDFY